MNTFTVFAIYFDETDTKFQDFVAKSASDAIKQAKDVFKGLGIKSGRPNGVVRFEAR